MKTMDEKSVPAPVLAVPVPVLVLDEEEAIEDLAAKILRLSPLPLPPTLLQLSRAHLLPSAVIADKRLPRGTPSARSVGPRVALPARCRNPWQRR